MVREREGAESEEKTQKKGGLVDSNSFSLFFADKLRPNSEHTEGGKKI